MNAIAFCLDLILATLLLLALWVGLRLDRKLKVLRDSQSGFAGAVAELDAAIVKAQDGLAALKSTALQTETAISDRIQDAKGMSARLDQQAKAAQGAAEKLERLLERYPSSSVSARDRDAGQRPDPGSLSLRERASDYLASRRPVAREALSRPSVQDRAPGPSLRDDARMAEGPRRSDDDDLFEPIEPALRAARSARR